MADVATVDLRHGDCLTALKEIPDATIDAIVTDPPYGLSDVSPAQIADVMAQWCSGDRSAAPSGRGFMGKSWDAFVPPPAVWDECLRVLKPGGHMAVFAGSRTQDLMGMSIRLAGFELRDSLAWIYGSGFPKSRAIDKDVDRIRGVVRERKPMVGGGMSSGTHNGWNSGSDSHSPTAPLAGTIADSQPITPEAVRWSGWGTALKPAQEPIILARKPLDGTVAANVLAHGVGGLNIDACRVGMSDADREAAKVPMGDWSRSGTTGATDSRNGATFEPAPAGRFPANVLLDEHAATEMDKQSGNLHAAGNKAKGKGGTYSNSSYAVHYDGIENRVYRDSGGASRFFPVFKYQAKAPKRERPVIEREDGTRVAHPTVKPLALMSWLVTLITPPGGVVLDPFAGSGTTLQAARDSGFNAIGIEAEADYIALIEERLSASDPVLV